MDADLHRLLLDHTLSTREDARRERDLANRRVAELMAEVEVLSLRLHAALDEVTYYKGKRL